VEQVPATNTIFKVIFYNEGKVYEIFALEVYPSDMMNFVTVEQLTFNNKNTVVVDPSEEKLKAEFSGVRRSFIPIQAIIRIDEVEKSGVAKISSGDNIAPFPVSLVGSTKADNQDV
jgi:hypothetical protein